MYQLLNFHLDVHCAIKNYIRKKKKLTNNVDKSLKALLEMPHNIKRLCNRCTHMQKMHTQTHKHTHTLQTDRVDGCDYVVFFYSFRVSVKYNICADKLALTPTVAIASRAEVARSAPLAVLPLRIVGADVAGPRHTVTWPRHQGVNVAAAVTLATHAARLGGAAIVTWCTPAQVGTLIWLENHPHKTEHRRNACKRNDGNGDGPSLVF